MTTNDTALTGEALEKFIRDMQKIKDTANKSTPNGSTDEQITFRTGLYVAACMHLSTGQTAIYSLAEQDPLTQQNAYEVIDGAKTGYVSQRDLAPMNEFIADHFKKAFENELNMQQSPKGATSIFTTESNPTKLWEAYKNEQSQTTNSTTKAQLANTGGSNVRKLFPTGKQN